MSVPDEFCPDCNHVRSADTGVVVSFTPDQDWFAEFAAPLAPGKEPSGGLGLLTGPDGTRWDSWRIPVIGWAVVEHHYEGHIELGHERAIEPVLLSEDQFPVTMTEYRKDHDMAGVHTRIARGRPPAPGGGRLPRLAAS